MRKTSTKRTSKQTKQRPVFESIRKPVPPSGYALGREKPEERAHPAERKAKHKARVLEAE